MSCYQLHCEDEGQNSVTNLYILEGAVPYEYEY